MIVETSVRPYIVLEKFLKFLFLSLWMSCDSGRRNYPISLKFGPNVYVLWEISCIIFDVYCLNSACIRIHRSISIHYGLWKKTC